MSHLQKRVTITGRVQGVAYRDWTRRTALSLNLTGWVRNRRDGSVEALFCGPERAVDDMIDACRSGPVAARVADVRLEPTQGDEALTPGFEILPTV